MKPLFFILLALLFLTVGNVFANEDAKKVNDYFNKTVLDFKSLPSIGEAEDLVKEKVNFNYAEEYGNPGVMYRVSGLAFAVRYLPKKQVDEHMQKLLKVFIKGGLDVKKSYLENIYCPLVYGMDGYIDLLLQSGCDLVSAINIGTPDNKLMARPIDLADKNGFDVLVNLLQKYGAKRGSPNDVAQMRLVGGAARLDENSIISAVTSGAMINAPDIYGDSALNSTIDAYNVFTPEGLRVVKLLLRLGASSNILNEKWYPLHRLIRNSKFSCRMMVRGCNDYDVEIVKALLEAGADVSAKDRIVGNTPLHEAAIIGSVGVARVLIDAGAKIIVKNEAGYAPLDLAKSGELIKLLKANGAVERGY